jgi:hypothetical protein
VDDKTCEEFARIVVGKIKRFRRLFQRIAA